MGVTPGRRGWVLFLVCLVAADDLTPPPSLPGASHSTASNMAGADGARDAVVMLEYSVQESSTLQRYGSAEFDALTHRASDRHQPCSEGYNSGILTCGNGTVLDSTDVCRSPLCTLSDERTCCKEFQSCYDGHHANIFSCAGDHEVSKVDYCQDLACTTDDWGECCKRRPTRAEASITRLLFTDPQTTPKCRKPSTEEMRLKGCYLDKLSDPGDLVQTGGRGDYLITVEDLKDYSSTGRFEVFPGFSGKCDLTCKANNEAFEFKSAPTDMKAVIVVTAALVIARTTMLDAIKDFEKIQEEDAAGTSDPPPGPEMTVDGADSERVLLKEEARVAKNQKKRDIKNSALIRLGPVLLLLMDQLRVVRKSDSFSDGISLFVTAIVMLLVFWRCKFFTFLGSQMFYRPEARHLYFSMLYCLAIYFMGRSFAAASKAKRTQLWAAGWIIMLFAATYIAILPWVGLRTDFNIVVLVINFLTLCVVIFCAIVAFSPNEKQMTTHQLYESISKTRYVFILGGIAMFLLLILMIFTMDPYTLPFFPDAKKHLGLAFLVVLITMINPIIYNGVVMPPPASTITVFGLCGYAYYGFLLIVASYTKNQGGRIKDALFTFGSNIYEPIMICYFLVYFTGKYQALSELNADSNTEDYKAAINDGAGFTTIAIAGYFIANVIFGGGKTLVTCKPGQFNWKQECRSCQPGHYQPLKGKSKRCQKCPRGKYTNKFASAVCSPITWYSPADADSPKVRTGAKLSKEGGLALVVNNDPDGPGENEKGDYCVGPVRAEMQQLFYYDVVDAFTMHDLAGDDPRFRKRLHPYEKQKAQFRSLGITKRPDQETLDPEREFKCRFVINAEDCEEDAADGTSYDLLCSHKCWDLRMNGISSDLWSRLKELYFNEQEDADAEKTEFLDAMADNPTYEAFQQLALKYKARKLANAGGFTTGLQARLVPLKKMWEGRPGLFFRQSLQDEPLVSDSPGAECECGPGFSGKVTWSVPDRKNGAFKVEGMTGCAECAPGTYQDGSMDCRTRVNRNTGRTSDQAVYTLTKCLSCDLGKYTDLKMSTGCAECPKGKYSDFKGMSECKSCGDFMTTTRFGATGSDECQSVECPEHVTKGFGNGRCVCGKYYVGTVQWDSELSKFRDPIGCLPVTCNDVLNSEPVPETGECKCIEGFTDKEKEDGMGGQPLRLQKAMVTSKGLEFTTDKGGDQEEDGSEEATIDVENTFWSGKCVLDHCRAGTRMSSAPVPSYCAACRPGQYQDQEKHQDTECKKCSKGTYSDDPETTRCKTCEEGKYQDWAGQQQCKDCCADDDETGPLKCDRCMGNCYKETPTGGECLVDDEPRTDVTNSVDDGTKPLCECKAEWKSASCTDGSEIVTGCPAEACDKDPIALSEETPWCVVKIADCQLDQEGKFFNSNKDELDDDFNLEDEPQRYMFCNSSSKVHEENTLDSAQAESPPA